jgi:isoleucyl-tRNA synthetase
VLRLWVASADYRNEISVSNEILKRSADAYRRIRNTVRFLLGNLHGFDPALHLVAVDDCLWLDQWIMARTRNLHERVQEAYEACDFARVVALVQNFCTNELGALYLDVTKDRLYTMQADSRGRRSAQSAMFRIAEAFVRWIAPILAFTADEVWEYLPGGRAGNVLFTTIADVDALLPAQGAYRAADGAAMDELLALRDAVGKVLEPMRAEGRIGASLAAEVDVYADLKSPLPDGAAEELRFLFITSQLRLRPAADRPSEALHADNAEAWILASPSAHTKCVRCWHYRPEVGADPADPELCGRCVENVRGAGEQRRFF